MPATVSPFYTTRVQRLLSVAWFMRWFTALHLEWQRYRVYPVVIIVLGANIVVRKVQLNTHTQLCS